MRTSKKSVNMNVVGRKESRRKERDNRKGSGFLKKGAARPLKRKMKQKHPSASRQGKFIRSGRRAGYYFAREMDSKESGFGKNPTRMPAGGGGCEAGGGKTAGSAKAKERGTRIGQPVRKDRMTFDLEKKSS